MSPHQSPQQPLIVFYDRDRPETVLALAQRAASPEGLQQFLRLAREQRRVCESPFKAAQNLNPNITHATHDKQ